VTWNSHHSASEQLAGSAESARQPGDHQRAETLYRQAALEEEAAFGELSGDKQKTRGITAVSAVALSYKAHDYVVAEHLACKYLAEEQLPPFAAVQLRDLLHSIRRRGYC
jgi:hypothetical protein